MSDSRRGSRGKSGWQKAGAGKERRVRRSDVSAWRSSLKQGDGGGGARRFARRILAVSLIILSVTCIFLIWWLWPSDPHNQVVIAAAEPIGEVTIDTAAAPAGFAANDVAAITGLYDSPERDTDGGFDFAQLSRKAEDGKLLILYYAGYASRFQANGGGDQDYLLTEHVTADQLVDRGAALGSDLRSLEDLWTAAEKKTSDQQWVILLDVAAPAPDWRLSLFGRGPLADVGQKIKEIPNMVVIGSASPGEQSWRSAHLGAGRSVFSHFVTKALTTTEANSRADAEPDEFLMVEELFGYVRDQVRSWVSENRTLAGQTVFIEYGGDPDERNQPAMDRFVLIELDGAEENSETPSYRPRRLAEQEYDQWRAFQRTVWEAGNDDADSDSLRDATLYDIDPLRWRAWPEVLLKAEKLRLADEPIEFALEPAPSISDYLQRLKRQFYIHPQTSPKDNIKLPGLVSRIFERAWGLESPPSEQADSEELPESRLDIAWEQFGAIANANRDAWASPELAQARVAANELRRRAETAACSPLGTYHWIAPAITMADRLRREGEDLIFLNDPQQAQQKFEQANVLYDQAEKAAGQIAATRRDLQRLWAELPEMGRWAAHQEAHIDVGWLKSHYPQSMSGEGLFAELLGCFRETRSLQHRFLQDDLKAAAGSGTSSDPTGSAELWADVATDQVEAAWNRRPDQAQELFDSSRELIRRLNALRDDIDRRCQIGEPDPYTWEHHVGIRSALNYSLISADIRRDLLDKLDECERATAAQSAEQSSDQRAGDSNATPNETAGDRWLWQAAWSVEVLGLSRSASDDRRQHQLVDAWERAKSATTSDSRVQAFRQLGDEIRSAWQANRTDLEQDIRNSASFKDLLRADQLARTLHGYDSAVLLKRKDANIARRLQSYFLAELYLGHAERYAEDYWADWYFPAATDCLTAAQNSWSVVTADDQREAGRPFPEIEARVAAVRKKLDDSLWRIRLSIKPDELSGDRLRFPEQDSGESGQLKFQSSLPESRNLPIGTAALVAGEQLKKGDPSHVVTESDFIVTVGGLTQVACPLVKPEVTQLAVKGKSAYGSGDELTMISTLFFRGHDSSGAAAPIDLQGYETFLTINYQALKPDDRTGEVIVKGDDPRSIVFVLDCSQSMVKDFKNNVPRDRFKNAKEKILNILKDLLERSAQRETPIRTGLVAFGLKERNSDGSFNYHAVDTIESIGELDQQKFATISQKLRTLDAEGGTPLTPGIKEAVNQIDLQKQGVDGIVVVITDGAEIQDKQSAENKNLIHRRREELKDGLIARAKPVAGSSILPRKINIHLISFDTTPQEWQDALNLAQKLNDALAGTCQARQVKDPVGLQQELFKAVQERRYFVRLPSGPTQDVELREAVKELDPRGELFEVGFPSSIKNQQFSIRGGESIIYRLVDGQLQHDPDPHEILKSTTARYRTRSRPDFADQLLLLRRTANTGTLRLALDHEKGFDRKYNDQYVAWPRDVFLDVRGRPAGGGVTRPRQFTWGLSLAFDEQERRSIPVWDVQDINWPAGGNPQQTDVTLLWQMRNPPEDESGILAFRLPAQFEGVGPDLEFGDSRIRLIEAHINQHTDELRDKGGNLVRDVNQEIVLTNYETCHVTVEVRSRDQRPLEPTLRMRLVRSHGGAWAREDWSQKSEFTALDRNAPRDKYRLQCTFTTPPDGRIVNDRGNPLYILLRAIPTEDAGNLPPDVGWGQIRLDAQ